ncbi:hypothetical protein ACYULU_16460 [Breznakiellaceae bacterium SP9]
MNRAVIRVQSDCGFSGRVPVDTVGVGHKVEYSKALYFLPAYFSTKA